MKNIFRILAAVVFALVTVAAISAEELTKEVVFTRLAENTVSFGKFTQTKTFSSRPLKLKTTGNYSFSSSEISWVTETPFKSTLTITETKMIQISPKGEKSILDFSENPSYSSIAKTIKSLFENNLETLEENFSVIFFDMGEGKWELKLSPKDKTIASAIKEISLSGIITALNSGITNMFISETNGDSIRYDFY